MKMTASGNIRNGTFKQISHHVNRTFLNKNYGTLNDKNLEHIQPKFSYLNLSNDGSQRIINGQLVFYYDKKKERSNVQNLANKVNSKYSDYIQKHNNKKSVRHNKSRQIHNLFKKKLLKKLPKKKRTEDKENYLDKYQRLYIQNCGNSEENLHNMKLIQKYQIKNHKHLTFQQANKLYRKSVSIALAFYAKNFHKFNPDLLITNYATNIDECSNKKLEDPDALHVHTAIIGLTQTKSGKPSFSVGRAICQQEHVKYNSATIKIHGKRVNNSLHKAMKKFRAKNGKIFLKAFLQPTLKIVFPKVKQFQNIHYYQTGQKVNGLSMNQERLRQNIRNYANQLNNKINHKEKLLNKKHKYQSYKNKINGAKRARTLRKYQAKRRYLVKRNERIKQAHRRLKQEQRVSIQKWKENVIKHEKLAIKIKSQHKIIKNNKIKINQQKSKLNKIRKLIHLKETELKNVATNLIKAFRTTLKQNNKANNYNIRAINKANSRLARDTLKQAHENIFTRIRSTFNNFHSNYSVSASKSSFSNYSNIYNSISSASSYSSALPLIKAARVSKSASLLRSNQAVKRSMARRSRHLTTTSPTISTPTYSPNQRGWER